MKPHRRQLWRQHMFKEIRTLLLGPHHSLYDVMIRSRSLPLLYRYLFLAGLSREEQESSMWVLLTLWRNTVASTPEEVGPIGNHIRSSLAALWHGYADRARLKNDLEDAIRKLENPEGESKTALDIQTAIE